MNEEEIENWYGIEKQKLEEEFAENLKKTDNPGKAREIFRKKIKKLCKEHDDLYKEEKLLNKNIFKKISELWDKVLKAFS